MRFYSIKKFYDLLLAGGLATFFVLLVAATVSVIFDIQSHNLVGGEIFVAAAGTIVGFAFIKVTWLLVFYPLVYRSRFEGSVFVVSALDSGLLLIALSAIAYLGNSRTSDLSMSDVCFMLVGSYIFFTFILWAITPVMHWFLWRSKRN